MSNRVLITAWSMAAVIGPQLVNHVSAYRIAQGVPRADASNLTMNLMAGLLLAGALCNALVRPVAERYPHREPAGPALSHPART